jgi:hypothetical protein
MVHTLFLGTLWKVNEKPKQRSREQRSREATEQERRERQQQEWERQPLPTRHDDGRLLRRKGLPPGTALAGSPNRGPTQPHKEP